MTKGKLFGLHVSTLVLALADLKSVGAVGHDAILVPSPKAVHAPFSAERTVNGLHTHLNDFYELRRGRSNRAFPTQAHADAHEQLRFDLGWLVRTWDDPFSDQLELMAASPHTNSRSSGQPLFYARTTLTDPMAIAPRLRKLVARTVGNDGMIHWTIVHHDQLTCWAKRISVRGRFLTSVVVPAPLDQVDATTIQSWQSSTTDGWPELPLLHAQLSSQVLSESLSLWRLLDPAQTHDQSQWWSRRPSKGTVWYARPSSRQSELAGTDRRHSLPFREVLASTEALDLPIQAFPAQAALPKVSDISEQPEVALPTTLGRHVDAITPTAPSRPTPDPVTERVDEPHLVTLPGIEVGDVLTALHGADGRRLWERLSDAQSHTLASLADGSATKDPAETLRIVRTIRELLLPHGIARLVQGDGRDTFRLVTSAGDVWAAANPLGGNETLAFRALSDGQLLVGNEQRWIGVRTSPLLLRAIRTLYRALPSTDQPIERGALPEVVGKVIHLLPFVEMLFRAIGAESILSLYGADPKAPSAQWQRLRWHGSGAVRPTWQLRDSLAMATPMAPPIPVSTLAQFSPETIGGALPPRLRSLWQELSQTQLLQGVLMNGIIDLTRPDNPHLRAMEDIAALVGGIDAVVTTAGSEVFRTDYDVTYGRSVPFATGELSVLGRSSEISLRIDPTTGAVYRNGHVVSASSAPLGFGAALTARNIIRELGRLPSADRKSPRVRLSDTDLDEPGYLSRALYLFPKLMFEAAPWLHHSEEIAGNTAKQSSYLRVGPER